MYALSLGRKRAPDVVARTPRGPAIRRADQAMPAVAPAMDEASPQVSVTVEVMPAGRRRYRGTVVRQVTQVAIVEYEADEGMDPYTMAEAVVAAVPETSWTNRGDPWAWIESAEAVDAAPADVEPADPAAAQRARRGRKAELMDSADFEAEVANAADLEDLADILNSFDASKYSETGDVMLGEIVDMADLPTFGGDEPVDTNGIWSWDAENWLVNDGAGYVLEPRGDLEAAEAAA